MTAFLMSIGGVARSCRVGRVFETHRELYPSSVGLEDSTHPTSDVPVPDLLLDPWDHRVEDIAQGRRRPVAKHPLRLLDIRDALLNVVRIGRVAGVAEWHSRTDLVPDHLRQVEHGGRDRRADVEVLVHRLGLLDAEANAAG